MGNNILTERVHFRLIEMDCCRHQVCWINPRLPNYCPECGSSVMGTIKSCVVASDENATLRCNLEAGE